MKSISVLRPENIRKSLERIELKFNTRCCDYIDSSKVLILNIKSAKETPSQVKKGFKKVLEEKGIQNIEVMLVEEFIEVM